MMAIVSVSVCEFAPKGEKMKKISHESFIQLNLSGEQFALLARAIVREEIIGKVSCSGAAALGVQFLYNALYGNSRGDYAKGARRVESGLH